MGTAELSPGVPSGLSSEMEFSLTNIAEGQPKASFDMLSPSGE
jgi:hypothetical protein